MGNLTVRPGLQQKLFVVGSILSLLILLFWIYWTGSGWVGKVALLGLFVASTTAAAFEFRSSTTFDEAAQTVEIRRFLRSYSIGFEDIAEVWLPRTGAVRLIVEPGTKLSPLLGIHRGRVPITCVPQSHKQALIVGEIAKLLDAPVRGSFRYRPENLD